MNRVSRVFWVVLLLLGTASAQEPPTNIDEVNRKYQDSLAQLKAAQDRINGLATENEKLNARVTDLEKQVNQLRDESARFAATTFNLRSHLAAWEQFVRRYPQLHLKWKAFLERDVLAVPSEWPEFSESPTSAPTTTPG